MMKAERWKMSVFNLSEQIWRIPNLVSLVHLSFLVSFKIVHILHFAAQQRSIPPRNYPGPRPQPGSSQWMTRTQLAQSG